MSRHQIQGLPEGWEPNLIDPDIGSDLRRGWVDVCTTVEIRATVRPAELAEA